MKKGILDTLNEPQANLIRLMQKHGTNLALETLAHHANTRPTNPDFLQRIDFLKMHGILRTPKEGYVELTDWAQESTQ